MDNKPHQDDELMSKLFSDADAKIADMMRSKMNKEIPEAASYSYGGKEIAVTCIGCEMAIVKAESARKVLLALSRENNDPLMNEGFIKLIEIAKRAEEQARERSLMHHHFPQSLGVYDAFVAVPK
ncbi:hypothetical protein L0Y49_01515 [bacterium]|nr:hypothetical protein [bacterium]